MMKRLLTITLLMLGFSGIFLWGAPPAKAQWCNACDLTGATSTCSTDPLSGVTKCSCSGGSGGCAANCPAGYYPCNGSSGACCATGGIGGQRCQSITYAKYVMPYSTPGDGSTATLHWYAPKKDTDEYYYRDGWSNSWWDDGCFGADCYGMFADWAGNKDVTVTVPAGYRASYLVNGAEYGSGWGTGNVASFYCGSSVRIDWYYTPLCSPAAPAAPTLSSPAEGAKLSSTSVNLLWNATSWGTACSGANNQYSVYTAWPSTLLTTVPAGTTATTFTGTRGTDYAWEVTANNGQLAAGSVWRNFRIMYDQIAGTVYNDPNNTCSQATRWSAGGTISDGSYSSSIAGDGTFSVEGPAGASYNLALALPTGYSCSTGVGCGICPVRSGVGSPSVGNLFFITNNKEKWWQAEGAPVYAGSSVGGVTVRSSMPNAAKSLILPGAGGTSGALLRASGSVDLGPGTVSAEGWNTESTYHGKTMDYTYFAAQMGVVKTQASDWLGVILDKPANDPAKDFWYSNTTSNITSPWSLSAGESYAVFVNGDLNIKANITVPDGAFLALFAKGNINVDPSVTSLAGIYLSGGNFTTQSVYVLDVKKDVALSVQGSVVAWGNMDLRRNLGGAENIDPGELFVYRPDLLTNMPAKLKTFAMNWQEVPAGTF